MYIRLPPYQLYFCLALSKLEFQTSHVVRYYVITITLRYFMLTLQHGKLIKNHISARDCFIRLTALEYISLHTYVKV